MHIFYDTSEAGLRPKTRDRNEIDSRYKWDLNDIYPDWESWEQELVAVRALMDDFVALKGLMSEGPERILEAYELSDRVGMMAYKLYRYPQLMFDVDQRDNAIQAKLQQVQNVFAEYGTRTAWFAPEILQIPEDTMMGWLEAYAPLAPYRFPISETYRNQAHVLDEGGEQLLSFGSRFRSTPSEIYRSLSTADVEFKDI